MKVTSPSQWSISTRLVLIATVPALMMFAAVTFALYLVGQEEVQRDVRERGDLIAASLAETSHYGLMSGNAEGLQQSMTRLIAADVSISRIEVLDAQGQRIAVAGDERPDASPVSEHAIVATLPSIDLLDNTWPGTSPDPTADDEAPAGRPRVEARPLGRVRVQMSPARALKAQRHRLALSAGAVLLAALMSAVAGLWLAQLLRRPLAEVMRALREIHQGRYDIDLPAASPDDRGELGQLRSALREMAQALAASRNELTNQVAQRTAELQAAIEQTRIASAERRRLIARSNQQLEDERQKLSADIQGRFQPPLIGLLARAQHMSGLATALPRSDEASTIRELAAEAAAMAGSLHASARELVKRLRPEVIDMLGLHGALRELLDECGRQMPTCQFELQIAEGVPSLRGHLAMTAYRLVQDALSNVTRHSRASRATVRLRADFRRGRLFVTVQDNGMGFRTERIPQTSLGLIGMRERVAGVSGTMVLTSTPGSGTEVTFRLPAHLSADEA